MLKMHDVAGFRDDSTIKGLDDVPSQPPNKRQNAVIVVNPDLVKERLDPSSKANSKLSERSIILYEEIRPLVLIVGCFLLFLVLLGAAVALGLCDFIPVACALIPLILGAIGGVIVGFELLNEELYQDSQKI